MNSRNGLSPAEPEYESIQRKRKCIQDQLLHTTEAKHARKKVAISQTPDDFAKDLSIEKEL
jgi:hypothetical protein